LAFACGTSIFADPNHVPNELVLGASEGGNWVRCFAIANGATAATYPECWSCLYGGVMDEEREAVLTYSASTAQHESAAFAFASRKATNASLFVATGNEALSRWQEQALDAYKKTGAAATALLSIPAIEQAMGSKLRSIEGSCARGMLSFGRCGQWAFAAQPETLLDRPVIGDEPKAAQTLLEAACASYNGLAELVGQGRLERLLERRAGRTHSVRQAGVPEQGEPPPSEAIDAMTEAIDAITAVSRVVWPRPQAMPMLAGDVKLGSAVPAGKPVTQQIEAAMMRLWPALRGREPAEANAAETRALTDALFRVMFERAGKERQPVEVWWSLQSIARFGVGMPGLVEKFVAALDETAAG
jgi:hypothetical protein